MVDEIIAIDGIVEELIAKDEICEKDEKDKNRTKVNSNYAIDSVIDQVFKYFFRNGIFHIDAVF